MLCLYHKITLLSKFFLFFSNWCPLSTVSPLLLYIIFVFLFEGLHVLLLWRTGGRFFVDFFFYASSPYLSVSFSSCSEFFYFCGMCRCFYPFHNNSILLLIFAAFYFAILNVPPISLALFFVTCSSDYICFSFCMLLNMLLHVFLDFFLSFWIFL